MKKISFVILLMLSVLPIKAQVEVKTQIDSTEILIGQQAHITLDVTLKSGMKLVLPEFKPQQNITPGVEVVEQSVADTSSLGDDKLKISRVYTLTSFDENIYYIPAMNVKVDGKDYKSKELALKVLTVEVDTLHPEKFYPPKDVQNNPFKWEDWSTIFWMGMILTALVILAYYLYTRFKENKPIIAKVKFVKRLLPHQKAMNEIERIKANNLVSSDNQKEYYTQLTDTLRKYIEERFGFNAIETADLVKFAKYSTLINENDNNLVNAIQYINSTKMEDQPQVERVEPVLTNQEKQDIRSRTILKWVIGILAVICLAILVYIIYNSAVLLSYELETWTF